MQVIVLFVQAFQYASFYPNFKEDFWYLFNLSLISWTLKVCSFTWEIVF